MVGLAFRAGQTITGTAACEKGLKHGRICLLLLQDDMSESSKKGFSELSARAGVDILTISGENRIGEAIGRPGIMVLGVTDKGFADAIRKNYDGGSGTE